MMRRIVGLLLAASVLSSPAAAANIVQTAKSDGHFTKLLAANETAGTAGLLQSKGPFTVFAPDDDAFAKVPAEKLAMLMKPENATKLKVTLGNHVVTGLLTMTQIEGALDKADAAVVMAANNMPLMFKREGGAITVNGAHLKKPPMRVENGIVYVVDTVMMPAMPIQPTY